MVKILLVQTDIHPESHGRPPAAAKLEESTADQARRMSEVADAEGGLVIHAEAGRLLGVSSARTYQLVDLGVLNEWRFLGYRFLSVRELKAYKAERDLRKLRKR